MAGAATAKEIPLGQLNGVLESLKIDPAGMDWTPAMKEIQVYANAKVKENFDRQQAPDGTPWAPRKRQRSRKRDRAAKGGTGQKLLVDTGLLRSAATSAARFAAGKGGNVHLVQSVNLDYAGFHQNGTRFIPARPFLGVTPKMADTIAGIAAAHVMKKVGG